MRLHVALNNFEVMPDTPDRLPTESSPALLTPPPISSTWTWNAVLPAGIAIFLVFAAGLWGGWRVWQQRQRTLQCQQAIEVVDRGYVRILEFQGTDPRAIETLANSLQVIATDLRVLELSNERITNYQTQFVSLYQQLGDAYGNMADEVRRITSAKPDAAMVKELKRSQANVKRYGADAHTVARQLETLSAEFNRYCAAGR
ncbi:MAG: hypothetical protein EAZ61_06375 [Oscillatoriales cyanobacterium]|nr:MAG: hypothetical protein EAZ61_06375 [Oscillatoriales cyanobacterium]